VANANTNITSGRWDLSLVTTVNAKSKYLDSQWSHKAVTGSSFPGNSLMLNYRSECESVILLHKYGCTSSRLPIVTRLHRLMLELKNETRWCRNAGKSMAIK